MTNQIVIRSSSSATTRRQNSLLTGKTTSPAKSTSKKTHKKSTSNVGEVAGGTTANICVVCCCCPCVVVEFLILAVYKVPANVVRRMWKNQGQKIRMMKKKKKNKKSILEQAMEGNKVYDGGVHVQHNHHGYVDELSDVELKEFEKVKVSIDGSAEALDLDKQMWERFKDAGFWRSPSQRLE